MIHHDLFPLVGQTGPTQETIWHLQTHWTWAPWFTVLFVVATVIGILYLYFRESSPAGTAYRVLLAALRIVSIALVLVMLSELLLSATRSGLPRLVVLIDHSASMGIRDLSADASRLDTARELFLADNASLLEQWQQDYVVELAVVADGVSRLEGETLAERAEQLAEVDTSGAESNWSRLGDAITAAIDERQGSPPAAIVLATDGRTTAGRSLDEARGLARRRGVPVYTIGYGPTEAPPDLALTNLLADEMAFVGDLVSLGVTVEATGLAGTTAEVVVRDATTNELKTQQTISIASDEFSESVQLVVQPEREGTVRYRIDVASAVEERDTQNNRLDHTMEVRDEKVAVLLAAGYPNYEFRYLKNLLERDSMFELTSYLQEADIDYTAQDATAIAQLPMREEELDEFDVVVLIDLNPRLLPPRWWQGVERHVMEAGGGVALVSGPRHFPWQYSNVNVASMLAPIDVGSSGPRGGRYDTGFQLELTPLGRQTAATQLGATPAESSAIWRGLPPLYWFVAAEDAKPAARTLATHPTARTSSGRPVPLAAIHYVGAGRVLYHGFDSSWRWRMRVGDVFFARYWGQLLRHLARSKMSRDGAAEIIVERDEYQIGESIQLKLRLAKSAPPDGGDAELLLTAPGQPNRNITLSPSEIAPQVLQATVGDLPPGRYRVALSQPTLAEPPDAVEFEVLAPPGELADVTMNDQGLRQLSEATYGKFYNAENAANLADDLPRGDRVPLEVLPPVELWNQWWMLLAITTCLTAEWILRKRRAML